MTFPKGKRLRKRRDFQRVVSQGERLVGKLLCIDCRKGASLRLGITASGKFGNALERNRFKRQVREIFRLNQMRFPPHCEFHVLPRKLAKEASFRALEEEFLELLSCR